MKTNKTTAASFSANALQVSVPTSWQELTDKQLLFVYTLLGQDVPVERVMLYAFLRFAGLHVVRTIADGSVYILRRGKTVYPVSRDDLLYGAMQLEFIGQPSTFPLRVEAFNGHPAVNSDLRAFPFGHYLQVENYFQAFLQSNQTQCLREIASLLYPGYKGEVDSTMKFNLVSWLYGVKHLFASEFPDLFRVVPQKRNENEEDDWPDMKAITEAEIRALNGGDITKTDAVLAADTWGALAELNAKAREAQELERIRRK
ncbi:MAG: hypothetical protein IKO20_05080 [Bacteroidaceae bacterium]|nr:hypothetical protein [Bacteroidaceae bacterium]